ncbi:SH3-domain-containing protein [Xylariaceae sp. FL0016]|nr:SH3-domain-containing protein [Xylariaceae sp. FL0016]
MDRQEIIATNKSLRLVKNELEHLLEKGVVNDDVFDQILRLLPNESSLSGAPTPAGRTPSALPSPSPLSPPTNSLANLALHQTPIPSQAPPAYNQTAAPALPVRKNPPPPPPQHPVIDHCKAKWRYAAAQDGDLSFEPGDKIEVHEKMNQDWWMGRNSRTGEEGIFPINHVEVENNNEKQGLYNPPQPSYATPPPAANGGYPPPPSAQNPYNAHVPPMAVAQGGGAAGGLANNSKVNENGKKFGKKLGNAAIFGAGATIGGKIVNGIF